MLGSGCGHFRVPLFRKGASSVHKRPEDITCEAAIEQKLGVELYAHGEFMVCMLNALNQSVRFEGGSVEAFAKIVDRLSVDLVHA